MNNIFFYTLGCSKNTVDSQIMKDSLLDKGYNIATDIEEAEVIVVNTCAFIQSAKEESIDAILEVAELKDQGRLKKLIIAGCLAERYAEELLKEIPEIDSILGTGAISDIDKLIETNDPILKKDINTKIPEISRRGDVEIVEYVKIAEGCNNNCSYCIIPKLRGRNRSRNIEDIHEEVKFLVKKGAKEIIIIAQNSTDYGLDIGESLSSLLKSIDTIEGDYIIRILYLYLDRVNDELLDTIKNSKHIVPYFDIPMQHISDSVLMRMNRQTTKEEITNLINKIRERMPNAILRTTLIVGFPGESEEEFNELLDYIKTIKFDKLGAFTYSREEDTPAYSMKKQIAEEEKLRRLDKIMQAQALISQEKLIHTIGKVYRVLIEEEIEEGLYSGRTWEDAPEIDGEVIINSCDLSIGKFYDIEIIDSLEYDRYGRLI